jgi:tetratricopeptide (TPR) repeat protein
MGWIYVSQRDDVRAVPLLEESVARFRQIGYTYAVATFGAMLSEALCLAGQTRRAREVAREGMALASEAKLWYQLAQNERVLGLIESAEGSFAKAAPYLQQAWQRFLSVEARFEAPRTQLDLAEVMHRSGRRDDCISHLTVARDTFAGLRLSSGPATLAFATNSIERAERLAETLGITLPPTSAGGGLPGSIGGT